MRFIQISLILSFATTMAFGQVGNQATVGATNDPKNTVSAPKSADTDLRTGENRLGDSSAYRTTDTKAAQFVERAAESSHAQIGAAHVALTKSTDAKVKSYAEMVAQDHAKSDKELMSLATKNRVALPDFEADTVARRERTGTQPTGRADASHPQPDGGSSRLAAATGSTFDRLYLDREIENHKAAIELFEKESKRGTNPDLKQFAQQTLPTLQAHLMQAKALRAGK